MVISIHFINKVNAQELISPIDSLSPKNDTIKEALSVNSDFAIKTKVAYKAKDSIRFDIKEQKAYLYGEAEIYYEDIILKANYVEISFERSELFAKGLPDSTGKMIGEPAFKQGDQEFTSATLTYNFKSKKGIIIGIFTKEGDGFLQGTKVKKFEDNSINIKSGLYTTCEEKHPHFCIKFNKARVIPKDKIVSGPAHLEIEDMPLPLILPFGFFPNKKGQLSGIIIPSYGESATRGFFLERGGYYLGLGNYLDFAIRGDIYSRGSWNLSPAISYNKRYKYSGKFDFGYSVNIEGDKSDPKYLKSKDFRIRWSHQQSTKARPNSSFSASVSAGSSKYNTFNPSSTQDFLTNTLQSNISYSTRIANNYSFSLNMTHSQNTLNKSVYLGLPELAFSVNRFYPFRSKNRIGKEKWFETISMNYSANAENSIESYDSLLFKKQTLKQMQNGMEHKIPVSSSIRIFKNFNWTNTVNFHERWYLQNIKKTWVNDTIIEGSDTLYSYIKIDTLNEFKTAHEFNFSSSIGTRLYGMYQFKNFKIAAIRHVISPSVSFNYNPDFGRPKWGYYDSIYDPTNPLQPYKKYSIFENGIYGTPPSNESGRVNFSLSNNLEMKVKSKKDTLSGLKKVVLIDNFSISSSYDLVKDSLNWSNLVLSGRTKLFKRIDITYGSSWNPYALNDSTGKLTNEFELVKNKRFFHRDNTTWAFSLDWSLSSQNIKKEIKSSKGTPEEIEMIRDNQEKYIDFNEAWNITFQYSFRYANVFEPISKTLEKNIIQTLNFSGNINVTPKWKIGFRSGYDFSQKDFSYTTVDIYRDLHCWDLAFNWIPMGTRKSYNLTIKIKSPILQDLKLTKKKDFRDY